MSELSQDEIIEVAGGKWLAVIAFVAVASVAEPVGGLIGEGIAQVVIALGDDVDG